MLGIGMSIFKHNDRKGWQYTNVSHPVNISYAFLEEVRMKERLQNEDLFP